MNVYEKIAAQQGNVGTTVWLAGEQLKMILTGHPEMEEIVLQDLERKEMSLTNAEKEIKAFADKRHKEIGGNCVGVAPWEAEDILRKFYGLPKRDAGEQITTAPAPVAPPPGPSSPLPKGGCREATGGFRDTNDSADDLIDLDAFL
ncbi:MAG: hypothetical protein IJY28_05065 [Clostridia bacterium]|nr:hypothetical protein [Clostridia bacterium]